MSSSSVSSTSSSSSASFHTSTISYEKPKKTTTDASLPLDLPEKLPHRDSPWRISASLFKRLKFEPGETAPYHKVAVTQADPEGAFVHTHFNHNPPKNRRIQAIYCLHNPRLTNQFEALLPTLDEEGQNSFFAPSWDRKEDHLRAKTIQRWQKAADLFSPFFCPVSERETRQLKHVRILPLWHGTREEVCDSVAKTGFAFFGTHDYDNGGKGDGSSTDIGFFGNGIYFTNSARYSIHYAPKTTTQHALLSWVSMREPYPVVSDRDCSSERDEPADKTLLKGKGPYKKHNAHFIPVAPIPGTSKKTIYYPCTLKREPWWDEIVVFQKGQTLPRFWVQFAVDLPYAPSSTSTMSSSSSPMHSSSSPPLTVGTLLQEFPKLASKPAVKEHTKLYPLFRKYYSGLLITSPCTLLSSSQLAIYNSLPVLLDPSGTLNDFAAESLLEILSDTSTCQASLSFVTLPKQEKKMKEIEDTPPSLTHISLSSPKTPTVPEMAFGKAAWEKYFGDIGEEPPLPPDIDTILNSLCPITGKPIREAYLLTLVPATLKEERFTLERLGELVKKPKGGGYATGYQYTGTSRYFRPNGIERFLMPKNTWVFMLRDVLSGSREKDYVSQLSLVKEWAKKTKIPYSAGRLIEIVTSLFTHYVRSEEALLSGRNPLTYTRPQEKDNDRTILTIGGFLHSKNPDSQGLHISFWESNARPDVGMTVVWRLDEPLPFHDSSSPEKKKKEIEDPLPIPAPTSLSSPEPSFVPALVRFVKLERLFNTHRHAHIFNHMASDKCKQNAIIQVSKTVFDAGTNLEKTPINKAADLIALILEFEKAFKTHTHGHEILAKGFSLVPTRVTGTTSEPLFEEGIVQGERIEISEVEKLNALIGKLEKQFESHKHNNISIGENAYMFSPTTTGPLS